VGTLGRHEQVAGKREEYVTVNIINEPSAKCGLLH
jgi:hypothetical protein